MTDMPRPVSNFEILTVRHRNQRLGVPSAPFPYEAPKLPDCPISNANQRELALRAQRPAPVERPSNWDALSNSDKMTLTHQRRREAAAKG
jgi:hypothetical protein